MLSFNEVEEGPLVLSCSRHGRSRETGYSGTDGQGGPFIPNMNGPGGPIVGGTVSSMTVHCCCLLYKINFLCNHAYQSDPSFAQF